MKKPIKLIPADKPCSDAVLRMMRNTVYSGVYQEDVSWDHVKPNWRADERWLTAEYDKQLSKGR